MVTKYHRTIEEGIVLFGKQWNKVKGNNIFRGNKNPLSIIDPKSKSVVNYQPDVYFILRNNKKLIFEVLESEVKKQDMIIADVICSFLVENVQGIIFIHRGGGAAETRILEALKTIYAGLTKKGIDFNELPDPSSKCGAYFINESKDPKKVRDKLIQYSDEERW